MVVIASLGFLTIRLCKTLPPSPEHCCARWVARASRLDTARSAHAIAKPFAVDWSLEDLESVTRTILKCYNVEIRSQSTIDALLELRVTHQIDPAQVDRR